MPLWIRILLSVYFAWNTYFSFRVAFIYIGRIHSITVPAYSPEPQRNALVYHQVRHGVKNLAFLVLIWLAAWPKVLTYCTRVMLIVWIGDLWCCIKGIGEFDMYAPDGIRAAEHKGAICGQVVPVTLMLLLLGIAIHFASA